MSPGLLSAVTTTPAGITTQESSLESQQATLQPQFQGHPLRQRKHIIVIFGPAGCGKTTIAEHAAAMTGIPYIEGDAYHPVANVENMRKGTPLTDTDRWDWLIKVREGAMQRLAADSPAVIVTCSALKQKYRDIIRAASYRNPNALVHFLYLTAPLEIIAKRVALRNGHYMGEQMVQGQFDILEEPALDETDITSFDASRVVEEVQADIVAQIRKVIVS